MMRHLKILAVLLIAGVAGSAHADWFGFGQTPDDLSGSGYRRQEARRQANVTEATVVAVREVHLEASGQAKAIGNGAGAAIGAIVANRVGQGNGRLIAQILGGVTGNVVGGAIAERVGRETAQELILQRADGKRAAITQSVSDGVMLAPGDAVLVIEAGAGVRVVRATVAAPPRPVSDGRWM